MILTCQGLNDCTQNPKINTITLNLLREYYEIYLSPYIFKYKIFNKLDLSNQQIIIDLKFGQENFCHLLGIESILRCSISQKELYKYKGLEGWENIKNGLIDFKFLKARNERGFKDNKSKYVFFYLIPKLLQSPKGVLYDSKKMIKSHVDCEMLFYDELQNAYVHIGIKKDDNSNYYIPKTFLVEKITNDNNGLKWIENQIEIKIESITKS